MFCSFCLNIAAHYKVLKDIIETTDIREFVEYHQQVIAIVQKLNKLFRPIVFTQFILTATNLCFTSVMVVKENDLEKIITAFFHAIAVVLETGIFAYGGQKLLDSSTVVCNQLYAVDKNYIPIIRIGQKGVKFDAGFFDASMETLSVTFSRLMSFITLLKSFV